MKVEIITKVEGGKLNRNRKLIKEALAQYEGKEIILSIERNKKKRSNEQNRYLHSMFTILKTELNELGNNFSMQEVKDMMKVKYIMVDMVNEQTGDVYGQRVKGTHECSTVQLMEFIDHVRKWAMDVFGIYLPLPGEQISIS